MRNLLERDVEKAFCKRVKQRGGLVFKFTSAVSGVPDRVVILGGDTFFVELKRPSGKVRKLQKAMIRKMREAGAEVYVIRSIKQIEEVVP